MQLAKWTTDLNGERRFAVRPSLGTMVAKRNARHTEGKSQYQKQN